MFQDIYISKDIDFEVFSIYIDKVLIWSPHNSVMN